MTPDPFTATGQSSVTRAIHWDPDADGPQAPWLVLAGSFSRAGNVNSQSIVAWDGRNWRGFGTGLGSASGPISTTARVIGLGTFQGQLVVTDGSLPAVKAWTGSAWARLGSGGPTSFVLSAESDLIEHNGSLYVGGIRSFTNLANQTVPNPLAVRVVGEDFERVGPALTSSSEFARKFLSRPEGLYAVGSFTSMTVGLALNHVALWDGTTWSSVGGGVNAPCNDAAFIGGQLYVVGSFTQAGGVAVRAVARWDGSQWRQVGDGSLTVSTSIIELDGSVYVAGQTASNQGVYRLDGGTWTWLEGGFTPTRLASDNADLIAIGNTSTGQDQGVQFPAEDALRRTAEGWQALGAPYNYSSSTGTTVWQDRLIANLGPRRDASSSRLGEWDGTTWREFPMPPVVNHTVLSNGDRLFAAAQPSIAPFVQDIYEFSEEDWTFQGTITFPELATFARIRQAVSFAGDTYLYGTFNSFNDTPVQGLLRWSDNGWLPVELPTAAAVIASATVFEGRLYLGGQFREESGELSSLASFDGASLTTYPTSGSSPIAQLLTFGDNLLIGGGTRVLRWDGQSLVDFWVPSQGVQLRSPFVVGDELLAIQSSNAPAGVLSSPTSTLVRRMVDGGTEAISEAFGTRQGGIVLSESYAFPVVYGSEVHLFGNFNQIGAANLPGNRVVKNWTRFTVNGVPLIVTQPDDVITSCGSPVELRATIASGYDSDGSLEYQWYLNGNALSETQFTRGVNTDTLTIPALAQPFTGIYTLTVTNSCGTATSREVFVSGDTPDCRACSPCAADFDFDGGVTGDDVAAFFTAYETNAPCADVDSSGGVDGTDLAHFFSLFEAGGC